MRQRTNFRKAFTLIELLVVIAIIAILSVVVIVTLNPAELLRQSRDSNRISDMSTLNSAVNLYSTDQSAASSFSLGVVSTTYVSIPDPTATSTAGDQCQGLGLPALATGYFYHCAATSTFRNINGTGWIPVNLSAISSGAPLGSLPVDPINASSSNLYYTYQTDGAKFQITSILESQKYKTQFTTNPQIPGYPEVISNGSTNNLSGLYNSIGLVGWWPLNEGSGTTAYDQSGNGDNGSWSGSMTGSSGYYLPGKVGPWAGTFDGASTLLIIPNTSSISPAATISVCAWFNTTSVSHGSRILGKTNSSGATESYYFFIDTSSNLHFAINDIGWSDTGYTISLNFWHQACGTFDGNNRDLYVDGVLRYSISQSATIGQNSGALYIGGAFSGNTQDFPGLINDVRVYNRALSAAEIQALYNAEK